MRLRALSVSCWLCSVDATAAGRRPTHTTTATSSLSLSAALRLRNRPPLTQSSIPYFKGTNLNVTQRINLRHRPVHVTCGLLSIDCWVVGIVPATVFLPTTYAPSSQKRWNVSGRLHLAPRRPRFVLCRLVLCSPSLRRWHQLMTLVCYYLPTMSIWWIKVLCINIQHVSTDIESYFRDRNWLRCKL